ncbi:MAG: hypothetical protein GY679_01430 [Mycoplasma sp.]|nr:hypothetical protein [Mycoplasma sp.]
MFRDMNNLKDRIYAMNEGVKIRLPSWSFEKYIFFDSKGNYFEDENDNRFDDLSDDYWRLHEEIFKNSKWIIFENDSKIVSIEELLKKESSIKSINIGRDCSGAIYVELDIVDNGYHTFVDIDEYNKRFDTSYVLSNEMRTHKYNN